MLERPLEPFLDLRFADATGAANLNQHHTGIRRDAAIKPTGEATVAGRHDRSHHPMPTGNVVCFQRSPVAFRRKDAVIRDDAILWLS